MDISTMRSYVRSVVDIDTSDISDDVMNRFLGEAYDVIVYSEKRWPFFEVATTFDTVQDQKDYTVAVVGAALPNGLQEIAALRTDNHVLEYIGRDDGDVIYPLDSNTTGNAWYWSFWADSIRLYPTPGSVDTVYVRGYKDPAAFGAGVSDATEPSDCRHRSTWFLLLTGLPVLTSSRKIRRCRRNTFRSSTRSWRTCGPATRTCRPLNR